MPENEIKDWIDNIVENTNIIDVQIAYQYIRSMFEDDKLEMIHNRINKMCDRCDVVYPEHYAICIKCGKDDKLRSFKIHNNMKELEKNW